MSSTPKSPRCRFGRSRCSSGGRLPACEPERRAPTRRRPLSALAGLVAMAALWWQTPPARAQQAEPAVGVLNEYFVKAAFLYHFGRYVEWPENTFRRATDPFVIGIVGEDSFDGALDRVAAKKTIQDRQIVVRRFASPDQYKQPCHILFVSRSLSQDQQRAL
ncbi:MAG: YfiR family protein, partial [Thermoguttaceae bacterium]